jgi:hypothetical protein
MLNVGDEMPHNATNMCVRRLAELLRFLIDARVVFNVFPRLYHTPICSYKMGVSFLPIKVYPFSLLICSVELRVYRISRN